MLRVAVALCLAAAVFAGPPVSRSRKDIERFRDFLEQTRTPEGVKLFSNPLSSAWANSGKYQGDILLDTEEIESMVQQYAAGRNAYIAPGTLWPQNTVVYEFASGHFDAEQRNWILHVMNILQQNTCIRFRQRRVGEVNYARITGNADGCYASVGYWNRRGVHTMNVARNTPGRGCMNGVVIAHEWLHVIGFFHMQSTHDRDRFVRINWQNIISGMEHNFERYNANLVSNLGLPYEHDSCMHYGPFDFSRNGRTTIDALVPFNGVMGQVTHITGLDLRRVDHHYNCVAWRAPEEYKDIPLSTPEVANVKLSEEINFE